MWSAPGVSEAETTALDAVPHGRSRPGGRSVAEFKKRCDWLSA